MMQRKFWLPAVALAGAGFFGTGALSHAAPINVNNADFENPAVPDNGYDTNPTFGWSHGQSSGSHLSGVGDPSTAQGAGYAGENNFAQLILNFPGPAEPGGYAFYSQDLGATVQPLTRYTINLTVGDRSDTALPTVGNGDTTGRLLTHFGITGGANLLNETATLVSTSTPTPADGGTALWSLTWETGAAPMFNGSQIYIRLFAQAGSAVEAVLFDNVSVNVSPVPEPAGAALLALGAAVLGRRRRVRN